MQAALQRSIALATQCPVAAELVPYWIQHIEEETGNDQWLLEDLTTVLGVDIRELRRLPRPEIAELMGTLHFWVLHAHPIAAVAYFYVVERSVASTQQLDWLAATFADGSATAGATPWSIKAVHRLIMNSEAYRRAPQHPEAKTLAERDPSGTSFAVFKPRRLTAEELRDSMLAVSGELNPTIGGIPSRPEMNREAALHCRALVASEYLIRAPPGTSPARVASSAGFTAPYVLVLSFAVTVADFALMVNVPCAGVTL